MVIQSQHSVQKEVFAQCLDLHSSNLIRRLMHWWNKLHRLIDRRRGLTGESESLGHNVEEFPSLPPSSFSTPSSFYLCLLICLIYHYLCRIPLLYSSVLIFLSYWRPKANAPHWPETKVFNSMSSDIIPLVWSSYVFGTEMTSLIYLPKDWLSNVILLLIRFQLTHLEDPNTQEMGLICKVLNTVATL